jgi:hypothetical protein
MFESNYQLFSIGFPQSFLNAHGSSPQAARQHIECARWGAIITSSRSPWRAICSASRPAAASSITVKQAIEGSRAFFFSLLPLFLLMYPRRESSNSWAIRAHQFARRGFSLSTASQAVNSTADGMKGHGVHPYSAVIASWSSTSSHQLGGTELHVSEGSARGRDILFLTYLSSDIADPRSSMVFREGRVEK